MISSQRPILNIKCEVLPQAAVGNTVSHFGAVTPATGSFIPKNVVGKFRQPAYRHIVHLTAGHTFGHDSKSHSTTQPHPQHALSRTPLTSDVRTRCASGIGEVHLIFRIDLPSVNGRTCGPPHAAVWPSSFFGPNFLSSVFLMSSKCSEGVARLVADCHLV